MKFERKPGTPLWRQLSDHIEGQIADNKLAPGSRLPNEQELADEFSISRHTVRRTMGFLQEKGLVRIEQGRGTFVYDGFISYPISRRTRFSENLKEQGIDPMGRMVEASEIVPEGYIAGSLNIFPNEPVTWIRKLAIANDLPVAFANSYIPLDRFPDFISVYNEEPSFTKVFQHFGVMDYTRLRTRIIARLPTEREARELRQPPSRPVVVTSSVSTDTEGKPILYSESAWASDRMQFIVEHTEGGG